MASMIVDMTPPLGTDPESWKRGVGVRGGWTCEVNSDCSFLSGGEERGWYGSIFPFPFPSYPPTSSPAVLGAFFFSFSNPCILQ